MQSRTSRPVLQNSFHLSSGTVPPAAVPPRRAAAARIAGGVVLAGLLAACGTAPLSFLYDRSVYYRAVLHRYPVFIASVDGQSTNIHPWPITPGTHTVALNAQPVAGFTLPVQKTYTMTIAPCTRYFVAAQRQNPIQQDWNLVVEQTEPVAGCDPQKELALARAAAEKGEQPPLSSTLVADLSAGPGALPPPALQQITPR